MKRIVILISGRGSNMEALVKADLPATIAAVISNVSTARGLTFAREHRIPTAVVDHRAYADRAEFDAALSNEIEKYHPGLVVLAGFMRVLTETFVKRYEGRLVNIHPSLLPAFPGLHTHQRAIDAGVRLHGCTVHFVTPALDHGPVIIQAAVPVLPDDNEEALAARVLREEHRIYPQAVRWFCEDRLALRPDGRVDVRDAGATAGALISPACDATGASNR